MTFDERPKLPPARQRTTQQHDRRSMPGYLPNQNERIRRSGSGQNYVYTPWFYRRVYHIIALVSQNPSGRRELGKIIREFRESDRRSLSQERFAEIADIDRTYYASIERGEGNPSFEMLWTIVSTLGISWQEFGRTLDDDTVLSKPPQQRR
jgi:DNA-binding XRE family transcriptional regulator